MKIVSDTFLPQASQQCAEMPLGMAEELAQARWCLLEAHLDLEISTNMGEICSVSLTSNLLYRSSFPSQGLQYPYSSSTIWHWCLIPEKGTHVSHALILNQKFFDL